MNHRLYIIEGLPCSGKSTTSAYIADLLKKQNTVCYVDEGSGDHPADYEFHAFLSEQDLEEFSKEEQNSIRNCSKIIENGYVVPLSQFDGDLFQSLLQKKIYDFLPWEIEKHVMLAKWKEFYETTDENTIYVFNCILLQNPLCETMMRFGFTEKESQEYISEIIRIIRQLNPVVIYLKNDDIEASVEQTAKEREGWLEAVINYHVNSAFGKSIDAHGFDGYIRCLRERQKRELHILSYLPFESFLIDNPQRDWESAYDTIRKLVYTEKSK